MEEILTKERRWELPKQTLSVEIFKKLLAARQLARHKVLQEQTFRNSHARLDARKASEDEDDYGSDDASGMDADQHVVAVEANGAVPMEVDNCEGPVISFGYGSASEKEGALGRVGPSSQRETTESVGPVESSAAELARHAEAAREAAEAAAAAEREAAEAAAVAEREAAAAEAERRYCCFPPHHFPTAATSLIIWVTTMPPTGHGCLTSIMRTYTLQCPKML